jgi:alpha-glucosidase
LELRRRAPALVTDWYEPVQADGDVLAYVRSDGQQRWLVALNLGTEPARLAPPGVRLAGRVELSTHPDRDGDEIEGELTLRGDEGLVLRLDLS